MNSIGQNIRKLRKIRNLSQVEFASRIGISQGNLSEIEQVNSKPSLDTLIAIKKQFKCNIDDLISNERADTYLQHEEVKLLSHYKLLDEIDRKEVAEIIKLKVRLRQLR